MHDAQIINVCTLDAKVITRNWTNGANIEGLIGRLLMGNLNMQRRMK